VACKAKKVVMDGNEQSQGTQARRCGASSTEGSVGKIRIMKNRERQYQTEQKTQGNKEKRTRIDKKGIAEEVCCSDL
jgi:hypothetical protein